MQSTVDSRIRTKRSRGVPCIYIYIDAICYNKVRAVYLDSKHDIGRLLGPDELTVAKVLAAQWHVENYDKAHCQAPTTPHDRTLIVLLLLHTEGALNTPCTR